MERPYGLDIKLNLQLCEYLDSVTKIKVLSKFKDDITSLDIEIYNVDQDRYIQNYFPLELNSIIIQFGYSIKNSKELVETILENNATTLTNIGLRNFFDKWAYGDNILKIPSLNKVKSLDLYWLEQNTAIPLIKSCKDTLTELKIYGTNINIAAINSLQLPNLKILHLSCIEECAALVLIISCKDMLAELKIQDIYTNFYNKAAINNLHLPNLKILHLWNIEYLKKCCPIIDQIM